MIARETVSEVLAEPRGAGDAPPVAVAGEESVQVTATVPGSVVPHWREGLAPTVLVSGYQRIMDVLADGAEPVGGDGLPSTRGVPGAASSNVGPVRGLGGVARRQRGYRTLPQRRLQPAELGQQLGRGE